MSFFEKINDDCILGIFEYLSIYESVCLADTCRRFQKLADKHVFDKFTCFSLDKTSYLYNGLCDRYFIKHFGKHVELIKFQHMRKKHHLKGGS